jgi:hypothetical protein
LLFLRVLDDLLELRPVDFEAARFPDFELPLPFFELECFSCLLCFQPFAIGTFRVDYVDGQFTVLGVTAGVVVEAAAGVAEEAAAAGVAGVAAVAFECPPSLLVPNHLPCPTLLRFSRLCRRIC